MLSMDNITGLNDNDFQEFDDYLLQVHENFQEKLDKGSIIGYNNNNLDSDDLDDDNLDDEFVVMDLVNQINENDTNIYETTNFLISIVSEYNFNIIIKKILQFINSQEIIESIITKLINIYGEKKIIISIYGIIDGNIYEKINNFDFFALIPKYYTYGYEKILDDCHMKIINLVSPNILTKVFLLACKNNNIEYINFFYNNLINMIPYEDLENIFNQSLLIVSSIETLELLLERGKEMIQINYFNKLVCKFYKTTKILGYLMDFSKINNLYIDHSYLKTMELSYDYLFVLLDNLKNYHICDENLFSKISNDIYLDDEYFDVMKELALNNKFNLVDQMLDYYKENIYYDNDKINDVWLDIKFDFEENNKLKDLYRIEQIFFK